MSSSWRRGSSELCCVNNVPNFKDALLWAVNCCLLLLFLVGAPCWWSCRPDEAYWHRTWVILTINWFFFSRSGLGACGGSAAGGRLIYLRLKHKARKLAALDHWSCANIKDDMCTHTRCQTCKASVQLSDGGLDENEFMMRLNWQELISPTPLLNRKRRKSGWTCGCKSVWTRPEIISDVPATAHTV